MIQMMMLGSEEEPFRANDLSIEAEDALDLSGLGNCFVDDPSG
jgi:hypothetical protein